MIIQTLNAELILPMGRILRTDEVKTLHTHVFVIRWSTKSATQPDEDWIGTCGTYFETTAEPFESIHNAEIIGDGLSCSLLLGRIPWNLEWAQYLIDEFQPKLRPLY